MLSGSFPVRRSYVPGFFCFSIASPTRRKYTGTGCRLSDTVRRADSSFRKHFAPRAIEE
jgi:hypothetical protein